MGNCQANDAAAVVIRLPDGQAERLYWPATAGAVMRSHPDHYVAHITLSGDSRRPSEAAGGCSVRWTKIRLLKHREMLLTGQVYRLMTSEEVTKEVRARKQERIRAAQDIQVEQQREEIQRHFLQLLELQNQRLQDRISTEDSGVGDSEVMDQTARLEREKQRSSRTWRPSLDSISEVGS